MLLPIPECKTSILCLNRYVHIDVEPTISPQRPALRIRSKSITHVTGTPPCRCRIRLLHQPKCLLQILPRPVASDPIPPNPNASHPLHDPPHILFRINAPTLHILRRHDSLPLRQRSIDPFGRVLVPAPECRSRVGGIVASSLFCRVFWTRLTHEVEDAPFERVAVHEERDERFVFSLLGWIRRSRISLHHGDACSCAFARVFAVFVDSHEGMGYKMPGNAESAQSGGESVLVTPARAPLSNEGIEVFRAVVVIVT